MAGYPNSDEIQGCASTYTGPMGGIGYVRERNCGETPDVRVAADQGQYFEDPNNAGNYHLYGFGIITGMTPNFNPNQLKTRGIGHRDIVCNKASKYESSIEVSYNPVDLGRIPFVTGIENDIEALEGPVCMGECTPYFSCETWYERECPEEDELRWLWNMGQVSTFGVSVALGEYVEWSETIMHQYSQHSTSKVYIPPIQSTEVGLNPLNPCCTAFMAYEGDVYVTRRVTEDITDQIEAGGTQYFGLTYNVMDFNRDGSIDGELGTWRNMLCFRDLEVYVDGTLINDTNEITVSIINSKYFMLASLVEDGSTLTVVYNRMVQLFNVTDYNFELNWNAVEARGIYKGLPVPVEIQGTVRDITGTMTINFKDNADYMQMKNDQFFHVFYEQGGLSATPIVFILPFTKWDEVNPPYQEDDLISSEQPYQAFTMCLDNQIRLPPDGETEEEEISDGFF